MNVNDIVSGPVGPVSLNTRNEITEPPKPKIETIDELWGTWEEIEYYRDKGMSDEEIKKYNLVDRPVTETMTYVLPTEDDSKHIININGKDYLVPGFINRQTFEKKSTPTIEKEIKTIGEFIDLVQTECTQKDKISKPTVDDIMSLCTSKLFRLFNV